jgi:hypothetical protein
MGSKPTGVDTGLPAGVGMDLNPSDICRIRASAGRVPCWDAASLARRRKPAAALPGPRAPPAAGFALPGRHVRAVASRCRGA